MKTHFLSLIGTVARTMVTHEGYASTLPMLGIDPLTWPDGRPRTIAVAYLELEKAEGHAYAQHKLSDSTLGVPYWSEMPSDPSVLKIVYAQEQEEWRFQQFQMEFRDISSAKEGAAAMERYRNLKVSGIEVRNFFHEISPIIQANEKDAAEGKAIIEIPDWPLLSKMIGGFNPQRVCLLVAETGFGKTNAALAIARSASKRAGALFVNMEMGERDIGDRLIMGETRTDFSIYKQAKYDVNRLVKMVNNFEDRNLWYTPGRSLSMPQIFALASHHAAMGMKYMFVDYDQKIEIETSREVPEWKAMQIIMAEFEEIAKRLDIWICLLSQGNEDGDPAASKRAKYSAATLLRFHRIDDEVVLTAQKNRFGEKGAMLALDYNPACSHLSERERIFKKEEKFDFGSQTRRGPTKYDPKQRFAERD